MINFNHKFILFLRSCLSCFTARADFRRARKKLLADATLSESEKQLLEKVSLSVHHSDTMYIPFFARHYLSVGLSALNCIERALDHGRGVPGVRSILDFPCGYGRVCRFLKVRFPGAAITVSEIEEAALDFCEQAFTVRSVSSGRDFHALSHPQTYDLIWCGSLITHTDEPTTAAILEFFNRHLAPGGRCVFTTHGHYAAEMIRQRRDLYGIDNGQRRQVLSGLHQRGYGFVEFKTSPGYGVSVVSRERLTSLALGAGKWKETAFLERGWDNHQDVYVFSAPGGKS